MIQLNKQQIISKLACEEDYKIKLQQALNVTNKLITNLRNKLNKEK